MAKNITRTISVYEYTVGKFNPDTLSVEGMEKLSFPYKLGDRSVRRLATDGRTVLAVKETTAVYSMSIEDFVRLGKRLDGGEYVDTDSTHAN